MGAGLEIGHAGSVTNDGLPKETQKRRTGNRPPFFAARPDEPARRRRLNVTQLIAIPAAALYLLDSPFYFCGDDLTQQRFNGSRIINLCNAACAKKNRRRCI
jgi:hypothetical protein